MRYFLFSFIVISCPAWADSFQLPIFDGDGNSQIYDSRDHPEGIFVLNFYAYHCCYSKANTSNFINTEAEYASEDRVHVLDIGLDRDDTLYARWQSHFDPQYPILMDKTSILFNRFKSANGIPLNVVADCNLNPVFASRGPLNDSGLKEMKNAIDQLLHDGCQRTDTNQKNISYRDSVSLKDIQAHDELLEEQRSVKCK